MNEILNKINSERISFDLEESHKLLGGTKNYLITPLKDLDLSSLIEIIEMFQKENLECWFLPESGLFVHEFRY
jgi:hypothetical protein